MSVPAMAAEVSVADAVPTTVGSTPGYTANVNPLHTPQATGQIVVAHSPLNTPTTNTGRSTSAINTHLSTKMNILNVGTTPGKAKN